MKRSESKWTELEERVWALPLDAIASPEFDEQVTAEREAEILSDGPDTEPVSAASGKLDVSGTPESAIPLLQLGCGPLLSRERERHLFRKMNYLKWKANLLRESLDIFSTSLAVDSVSEPTPIPWIGEQFWTNGPTAGAYREQLERIFALYHESVRVKNEIVASNLRLVISIAKKHMTAGISFFDLLSDGNLSLMKAVDKFDYSRGNKFSTYASWAIWRNFARSIPDERRYLDHFRPVEIDSFEGRIDDRRSLWQQERAESERRFQLDRFLSALDDRERTILELRYGLDSNERPQTLRQVGREIGVTKERIRQIETRALEKLRRVAQEEHFELPEPF